MLSALFTPPTDDATLQNFYNKIGPGGIGWNAVISKANAQGIQLQKAESHLAIELVCVVVGIVTVFSTLFATGSWIYGHVGIASGLSILAVVGGVFLFWAWGKMND